MAYEINSPVTGESLKANDPNGQRKLWEKGCHVAEQQEDFFAPMEGASPTSIIQTKEDTSKGRGHTVSFTNRSGFYDEGKQGGEIFTSAEDHEEILTDTYSVDVDYLRHSVRYTERAEEVMGMRGEIVDSVPTELGKWLGRVKTHRLFMMYRDKIGSENVVYAGRKSFDTLSSADTLSWDAIVTMGTILKPLGGRPAMVGKDAGGKTVFKNCVVSSTTSLFSLDMDSEYRQLVRDAGTRGRTNSIFSGGYEDVKGHVIKEYNPIDHDGQGPIGSPMNPKAALGVAIPAAFAAGSKVKGGGDPVSAAVTKKAYFRDFPNYAYKFLPSDILAVDGNTRYFLVINPANAAVDPGKVGMYAYTTGNSGNDITITDALGSNPSRSTTVGSVTFNDGAWAGKHTEQHPVGSTIIPCNAKGVPIGWTHMLGQRSAFRAYGKHRNRRTHQDHEGGFIRDVFVTSVFGQKLRQNRLGRHTGVITLVHAVQYPEFDLPVIS